MAAATDVGPTTARGNEESEECWPAPVRPHPDAPNV